MYEQSTYDWLGCHLQLLQLKALDTSDETIVEQWLQVPYFNVQECMVPLTISFQLG
jgi:hypothetical protein